MLLASPITLIALLTTVAHSWRQEALTENYREVARLGKEFYERLATFADRFDELRKKLDGAVQAYNEAAGSFEARVLVSARRLRDLEVTTAAELPPADPIERVPRVLKQVGLMGLPDEATTESEIDEVEMVRSAADSERTRFQVKSVVPRCPIRLPTPEPARPLDFIREIVASDLRAGRHGRRVHTRFPPEPNGYLHIGHAKSICLNFGVAEEFGGLCNLRFDDTNPAKEDVEYVESIQEDVRWLGFDWAERMFYASDYFEPMYACAEQLIRDGKAYVDSLTADEIREYRGTLTEPGRNSPYRDRPATESLDLFRRMRAGEFPDGAHVLRARIDMASPNINMRDPTLYRIRHATHHRTGDAWCIYPTYDYAHPISDAIEGITHSLCTLEFEDHRPLYDWVVDHIRHDAAFGRGRGRSSSRG